MVLGQLLMFLSINANRPRSPEILGAANAGLLLGALAGVWNAQSIALCFIAESAVIGLSSLAQMRRAAKRGRLGKSKDYQYVFFIAIYSSFVVLYGSALFSLIEMHGADAVFVIGIGLLAASHYYSYRADYLGNREYLRVTSFELTAFAFARGVPPQLVFAAGLFLLPDAASSPRALATLIAAKTLADLATHVIVHRRICEREPDTEFESSSAR
jgi:hypothetical protein